MDGDQEIIFPKKFMEVLSPMVDKLMAPIIDLLPYRTKMYYKSLKPIKIDDIPITPALTLNQKFEKNRIYNTKYNVRPFSILTTGAIYRITQTTQALDYENKWNDIITIVREGADDCTKIRVWAPNGLADTLEQYQSSKIVYVRPTGMYIDINTKKQYYTYELSIDDL